MATLKTKKIAVRICKVIHAITKDSYPALPELATVYQVWDTIRDYKTFFRNGETQIRGFLNETNTIVTIPEVWTDIK